MKAAFNFMADSAYAVKRAYQLVSDTSFGFPAILIGVGFTHGVSHIGHLLSGFVGFGAESKVPTLVGTLCACYVFETSARLSKELPEYRDVLDTIVIGCAAGAMVHAFFSLLPPDGLDFSFLSNQPGLLLGP